jgi:hypothetical protein
LQDSSEKYRRLDTEKNQIIARLEHQLSGLKQQLDAKDLEKQNILNEKRGIELTLKERMEECEFLKQENA